MAAEVTIRLRDDSYWTDGEAYVRWLTDWMERNLDQVTVVTIDIEEV